MFHKDRANSLFEKVNRLVSRIGERKRKANDRGGAIGSHSFIMLIGTRTASNWDQAVPRLLLVAGVLEVVPKRRTGL